ncbi:MAG: hypothetical protein ACRCUY_11320 [Thermoguttaceae bacterium]
MSDTSINSGLVEQTKNQIRLILAEIAQISKRDISPHEFHSELMNRVVMAMGAVGGAIWTVEEDRFDLAYQANFKALDLSTNKESDALHSRLVQRMLNAPDSGIIVPPHSSGGQTGIQSEQEGNPTPFILLFCPIRTELERVGVIEVIHRNDVPPDIQRGFLQFLVQSSLFAADYYKNRQLRHFGERQNLWMRLDEFTRTIHRSLNVHETTFTLVNEGRRLIECDRVSIALRRGNRYIISAVSGQDVLDKRSTLIRLLGKLGTSVARAGEPIWYTGDATDLAPQIERAIQNYVDESHSKMIAIFPLSASQQTAVEMEVERETGKKQTDRQSKPFGVLIVEQIEDSRVSERVQKRIEIVSQHSSAALGNALEHQSIFLFPLWKMIGKSKIIFTARMLPKTLLAFLLFVGLILAMIFVPWDFQMHCTGTLEPVVRRHIFSPIDAEIKEVFVDHQTAVFGPSFDEQGPPRTGSPLLELYSHELDNTEVRLLGEKEEIVERIASLNRQKMDQGSQLTPYEITDIVGQLERATIALETNAKQYQLLTKQKNDLTLTSPIDGVVVSWDIKQRLAAKRPVSRMQTLMEVACLDGSWQLELAMPEKRMGNIANYVKEYQMSQNKDRHEQEKSEGLRVEFVLATDPNVKYFGTVREIHDRAEVRSDLGSAANSSNSLNIVSIKVALDDPASLPASLRPGAECSAKIYCGKKPLGYVIFHEAIAFVHRNILFRLF